MCLSVSARYGGAFEGPEVRERVPAGARRGSPGVRFRPSNVLLGAPRHPRRPALPQAFGCASAPRRHAQPRAPCRYTRTCAPCRHAHASRALRPGSLRSAAHRRACARTPQPRTTARRVGSGRGPVGVCAVAGGAARPAGPSARRRRTPGGPRRAPAGTRSRTSGPPAAPRARCRRARKLAARGRRGVRCAARARGRGRRRSPGSARAAAPSRRPEGRARR